MAESLPLLFVMATGIPEIFLSLLLGFRLFNDEIGLKHALLVGIIASLINYLARIIGVVFGVHTVLTVVSEITACALITRKNVWAITSSVFSGFIILLFIEVVEVQVAHLLQLNIGLLFGKLIMAFFKIFIMSALLLIIKKTNFSLFNTSFWE